MKCRLLVAALLMVLSLAAVGRGQTRSEEIQRLREESQRLQEKLRAMENEGPSSVTRERTTQLGRTRLREEEPEFAVRIYDLSDLLAPVSPYPATLLSAIDGSEALLFPTIAAALSGPSGMSGMGGMGGMFSVQSSSGTVTNARQLRSPMAQMGHNVILPKNTSNAAGSSRAGTGNDFRIDLDTLIDAITSTIDATSWDMVGGQGSIKPLGNSLIVSAAPKTHDQIAALLDSFRKRWGTLRTITVQAHWLWLTDLQLDRLLGDDAPAIDDKLWDARLSELQAAKDQPAGYRAIITCYNGQTVSTLSGNQRRIIAGMIPVVDGGGEGSNGGGGVGYQPQVATLQEGAALQITPMTTTAGKYVVLDVHSRVVRLREPIIPPPLRDNDLQIQQLFTATGKLVAALDRPIADCSRLETTLRVPVGRRMLVGGMTFQAQPKAGEPGLYLFVKLGVQELRDDLPESKSAGQAERPQLEHKIVRPPDQR